MTSPRDLFDLAMAAKDEAYLDAEKQLRAAGTAAVGELRRHQADAEPIACLFADTLIPWIEGASPDNDAALAYLDELPVRIARTPAGTPRADGIPWYLRRHYQDRVVPIMALRLVMVPSLPRWYALGVASYLGEQRNRTATSALVRFAVETREPAGLGRPRPRSPADEERWRLAVDAIKEIADPDLRSKLEAERACLARRGRRLPVDIDALAPP